MRPERNLRMMREKINKNMRSLAERIRRFMIIAAALVIMTGCAANPQPGTPAEETGTAETEKPAAENTTSGRTDAPGAESEEKQPSEAQSTEAVKPQEEEKVTLVIPTVYENVSTQEEADEIRDRNGYESATLEEDGSLTVVMSRSQYEEEYNDDYSVFTVTVSTEEIGIPERQTANELVMYGTLYQIYTAGGADRIRVDYVNRDSGEVIESADSGSLDNAY